jgi:hypothetical protein
MAWLRVRLTEEEQRIVNEERTSHPKDPFQNNVSKLACYFPCGSTV